MDKRLLTLTAVAASFIVLGAACKPKATVTSGNTSVTVNVPVNAIVNAVNSSTTGDFSTVTNTVTNTAPKTATVTITAAGVSPKTLTVAVGTTVTFVNADTISHQLASDPHPSHSGLPGFDNTSQSASYSFTFTKSGTFGYHDHEDSFNSALKGTIIVQ